MKVLYLCDRLKCENCHDECKHTSDITHAVNFQEPELSDNKTIYWEKEEGIQKTLDRVKNWVNLDPGRLLEIEQDRGGKIARISIVYRRDK